GYTLQASATTGTGATLSGSSATFAITPGAATHLVFSVEPVATAAGAAITPAVQVTARDALENTATGFTGNVTVTLAANPTGGTLSGTTVVAASAGIATFSGLAINKAGTGYTLSATAAGQTGTTSTAFDITPASAARDVAAGAASQLAFTVQPTSATAGSVITPAVRVVAQDALGNTATSFTVNVSVALGSNPGGATLAGTTTMAAVAGVATFGNLSVDKAGTG